MVTIMKKKKINLRRRRGLSIIKYQWAPAMVKLTYTTLP